MYIATSIKSNVRELEGPLIRLAACASPSKKRIDLDFGQETLGAANTRPREIITVEGVIRRGAWHLCCSAMRPQTRFAAEHGICAALLAVAGVSSRRVVD